MAMMVTLSSGDNFGLDVDVKHIDVRIMGSPHHHLFASAIDDMTMAMRRYGDGGDMTMAMMVALSSGDNFGLDVDVKHVDVRIMG